MKNGPLAIALLPQMPFDAYRVDMSQSNKIDLVILKQFTLSCNHEQA